MDNSVSSDHIFLIVLMGILIMVAMAMALLTYFYYSRRKILISEQKAQQLKLQYQEELIQNNFKVQEKERKRIAEDLHDEIGSKLNVINLYLHQLKKSIPVNDSNNELLSEMDQTLGSTIDVSRNIAHELLPPTLDNFGLFPALKELTKSINGSGQINIKLEINAEPKGLKSKWAEVNVFRVLQEMLTNSIKYCERGIVQIKIDQASSERFTLVYSDDGPGYDANSEKNRRGLGMGNIENRLKMIGAAFTNDSKLGHGAHYEITYMDTVA